MRGHLRSRILSSGDTILRLPSNWLFIVAGIILSSLFLSVGIRHLVSSYHTEGPYLFLMLFFSASMIILINGTILFVLIVLAYRKYRGNPREPENGSPES